MVAVVGCCLSLALVGCEADTPFAPSASLTGANGTALPSPPVLQSDEVVDLTVYYRVGSGVNARLEPVVREVPVTEDLPRRALELLLAGPEPDAADLAAPLPSSTQVLGLTVEGGTARVDLSGDVITDAASVGATPEHEALALAALVDTLTEFTSIEQVEVSVDGQRTEEVSAFWGGWGLPEVLVRDESLLRTAQADGDGVVDLARFSAAVQQIGTEDGGKVRVASIRVRERVTHTRIIIELSDAEDADATAATVPLTRVRLADTDLVLRMADVVAMDGSAAEGVRVEDDTSAVRTARTELDTLGETLRIVLGPAGPSDFWLHTLTNPTRVVLDVKR